MILNSDGTYVVCRQSGQVTCVSNLNLSASLQDVREVSSNKK